MAVNAIFVQELNVGDCAVFDPILGPEEIMSKTEVELSNGCTGLHMQVRRANNASRFVVRGLWEPVMQTSTV
jgi:hypothetical protein